MKPGRLEAWKPAWVTGCLTWLLLLLLVVLLLAVVVVLVVVVVVPNGLVMDLWAKHTFSNNMYKTIGKHHTFEQPMLQKSHKK